MPPLRWPAILAGVALAVVLALLSALALPPISAAAVQHEIPRRLHPVLPRIERPQLLLDAVGSLPGEAEPGGDALDMAVDGDRRNPKGVPEDDRCGLATDASKPHQRLHVARDLAAELGQQLLGGPTDRLRLHPEEAGGVNVALELLDRHLQVVGRAAVLREESARHLVDVFVLRLRGQDRRDEELERAAELERRPPVRLGLGQARQHTPRSAASRRRILATP